MELLFLLVKARRLCIGLEALVFIEEESRRKRREEEEARIVRLQELREQAHQEFLDSFSDWDLSHPVETPEERSIRAEQRKWRSKAHRKGIDPDWRRNWRREARALRG